MVQTRPFSAPLSGRGHLETRTKKCNVPTTSFHSRYLHICQRYDILPMAKVKSNPNKNALNLPTDQMRMDDWKTILETLQSDQGLEKIVIQSTFRGKVLESAGTKEKAAYIRKCPVLFTAYGLRRLIESLVKCLSINNCLIYLELQGIPLSFKYLDMLLELNLTGIPGEDRPLQFNLKLLEAKLQRIREAIFWYMDCMQKGVSASKSLKHLSFIKIPFGDDGTSRVCRVLHILPNISSINFTACGLTSMGVSHIANLIKTQKIHRFVQIWQQSLRYQRPNLDSMCGLRQITLNCNPAIGDEGMKTLLEGLEDDLWIKGIEMNVCGLGICGAMELISFLQKSYTISVIDIRGNKNVPAHLIQHIMLLLGQKTMHYRSEFQWNSLSNKSQPPSKHPCFLSAATGNLRDQKSRRRKELEGISQSTRCHTAKSKLKQSCLSLEKLKL